MTIDSDLGIPERLLDGFTTTAASKERIFSQLYLELDDQQCLKWRSEDYTVLEKEMYACRAGKHTGDTVMSLALAVEAAQAAHRARSNAGRILGVIHV